MRYTVIVLLFLAACSTPQDEAYWKASNSCEQHMWTVWDNSNHVATGNATTVIPNGGSVLAGLAVGLGGTFSSYVIADSTSEHSKSGPVMTEHDRELVFQKCMKAKGYIEKP